MLKNKNGFRSCKNHCLQNLFLKMDRIIKVNAFDSKTLVILGVSFKDETGLSYEFCIVGSILEIVYVEKN